MEGAGGTAGPNCGTRRWHRHHRQIDFARNLSRSFFEMPQKRYNSNGANSMFEYVIEELRAKLLVDSHSWASGQCTDQHQPRSPHRCGGFLKDRKAGLRGTRAVGPGRTTCQRAKRSSRCGRLAGRPRCSPAPRPGPAPRKPAGPQATASVTQQHVVSYNPSVILGA